MNIRKYFWDLKPEALDETMEIIKIPGIRNSLNGWLDCSRAVMSRKRYSQLSSKGLVSEGIGTTGPYVTARYFCH